MSTLALQRQARDYACAECRAPLMVTSNGIAWSVRCTSDRAHRVIVSYRQLHRQEIEERFRKDPRARTWRSGPKEGRG